MTLRHPSRIHRSRIHRSRTALGLPVAWALDRADSWAVASQQQSRRNAMVAATRLAQRRLDAREAEEYYLEPPVPLLDDRDAAARA